MHAPISRFRRRFCVRIVWLLREPVRLLALPEKWTDDIHAIGAEAPVIPSQSGPSRARAARHTLNITHSPETVIHAQSRLKAAHARDDAEDHCVR